MRLNGNGWRVLAAAALLALPAASTVQADFDQAMNYFRSGKYVEAAAEFQTLVDSSPSWSDGYYMLGQSLLKMEKAADAEQSFQKAVEIDGEKFEYHHGLAKAYFDQKKYSNSIAALKTAEPLATDPQAQFALYTLRGYSYSSLEKWGDAVEDLEKSKAIKSDASIAAQLGKAYYSLGYNDKAVPAFREAVKSRTTDRASLQLLAESLMNLGAETSNESRKQGYYDEALQVAEKCLSLKREGYEGHNLVGRAALGAKNFPKAEQAFRSVLAQKPNYCYAMVNLGKTYIAQKKWSDAEGILTDAAKCAPRMAVVHENLGFVVEKQKRLEEAIGHYGKAQQIKPSSGVSQAITRCEENIRIRDENLAMEAEEQKQKQEEDTARREYEEAMSKQKEWEEKRKRDE